MRRHLARAFWNHTWTHDVRARACAIETINTILQCRFRKPSNYLQHSLRQSGLLRQLLQVFGVRIVIDGEVRLHRAQLVVLERGAHPFGT